MMYIYVCWIFYFRGLPAYDRTSALAPTNQTTTSHRRCSRAGLERHDGKADDDEDTDGDVIYTLGIERRRQDKIIRRSGEEGIYIM